MCRARCSVTSPADSTTRSASSDGETIAAVMGFVSSALARAGEELGLGALRRIAIVGEASARLVVVSGRRGDHRPGRARRRRSPRSRGPRQPSVQGGRDMETILQALMELSGVTAVLVFDGTGRSSATAATPSTTAALCAM